MSDYDPQAYGASIADDYDRLYDGILDTDGAVACLAELAGEGPVLELGIGTGRLALPLAERGLTVRGVESSPAMVDQLRTRPGGAEIEVVIGDFADVQVPGPFSLVVLALNTIFALPSQHAQVECFANAASHLAPGGRFVIEAWVPDPSRFVGGSAISVRRLRADHVSLDVAQLDPVGQRMTTTQVSLRDGEVRLYPANHRYAWPAEFDLMGRLAGLVLEQRWGGWERRPFTDVSAAHVSVYRRP
ncbi:MAG: class I SAM-dependent DNA methyltransferase [Acidimicrobiales bacterium]